MRILIADDELVSREKLLKIMATFGQCMAAENGEDALRFASSEEPPDLILLDIVMPGMDGYEVCKRLKADKKTSHIPVIFISVKSGKDDEAKGLELGAVDYITKPFRPSIVKARARTHLELTQYRNRLEELVDERTVALKKALQDMQAEVTGRKHAEEAFLREQNFVKQIMETSPVGITVVDREGHIPFANFRAEEILGLRRSDIYNRQYDDPAWQITDFEGNKYSEDQLPFQLVKRKKAPVFGIEHAIVWPDGKRVILSISGAPIFDSNGNFDGMVAIIEDVTGQKQAEAALVESEERFRTLVEQSPLGISLIDNEGRYKYLNPKFKEMFGYDLEDTPTGKEWFHKAYPQKDYRKEVVSTWKEDQRNIGIGEARPRTYRVICKDGQKRLIHFRPVTLENGDQLVFHEDVTEAEILEKQLLQAQKVEALSTLTGGIAHDYNNLLAVIIGNLSLIMERVTPGSELADFVNEVNKAALKVSDLTHELMALSRGGVPIKKLGSLKECITNAAKIVPSDVEIMLEMSIPEDLWPIPHDASKMEAAFRNVVKNAVEAMPDGGPLAIRAENLRVEDGDAVPGLSVKTGDYVRISIQDRGIGISEENLDKLFDPYFSTKPMGTQKGMGLGLATAHAIIKKHGGDITIQSTPDMGTTVSIYLPAHPSNDAAENGTPASLKTQFTIADQKAPRQRILLMDDEEMLRNLAKQMLSRLGYEVETVKDGVEAIEGYRKQFGSDKPFDAVILDLTIKGGMGGEQTLKELLKIDPEIKAVVSSGYFNDPVMADFQDYGFKGAMAKPYELKDLKEVLEKVLSMKD